MLAITDVDIAQQKLLSDKASQVVENGMRDFFMLCKKVFLFSTQTPSALFYSISIKKRLAPLSLLLIYS